MTAYARLEVWLLGGFRVAVDGRSVPAAAWHHRKPASLVKLLALEPAHRLHREQVFDALWPDLDPAAAGNNLRFTLHAARRLLAANGDPAPFLSREGESLVLGPTDVLSVDVDAFEAAVTAAWRDPDPTAAEAAVSLYAGDLLPDDPYEDWVAGRRAALRASFLTLLVRLAGLHERRGELGWAIAAAQRLVAAEPADEAAHALLIRLYAQAGQRRQALAQYDRLVEALAREVGAEPEAATCELREAIAAGRFPEDVRPLDPPSASGEVALLAPPPLPAPPTALIGREREIAEGGHLLNAGRLVTLTGPGGIGKTRLALAVAQAAADRFADGAVFVDLVPIRDPALVLSAIAKTLGIQETGGQPLLAALRLALKARRRLLILDNFEHVAPAAPLVGDLLAACPTVRLLVTSRVRLRLRGEQEYPLRPLVLPDRGRLPAAEALSQYAAVALFVQRAREARPDFRVTNETAPAVAEICTRLDGLPLAIELAAARTRVLPPPSLLARLDRPLALLTSGPRDLPARQQTLRSTIAWSYDLLEPAEQALFRRLAVFVGGFTLDAVLSPEFQVQGESASSTRDSGLGTQDSVVLDLIESLVDKSLVLDPRQDGPEGEPRYRMLETIREFGLEQLAASGEEEITRAAHARFYRALGDAVGTEVYAPTSVIERLAAEAGNLRAALGWAADRGEADTGLRLAHAFAALAFDRGWLEEGRTWLERLLPRADGAAAPLVRVRALLDAGWLALMQGNAAAAVAAADEAAAAGGDGDPIGLAGALMLRGRAAMEASDRDEARRLLDEALALCRGRPGGARREALVLSHLGLLTTISGDPRGGAARYEAAIALLGPDDEGMRALLLGNLATAAQDLGDLRRMAINQQQVLQLRRVRNLRVASNLVWDGATLAVAAGRPRQAARLLAAAVRLLEHAGFALYSWNEPDLRRLTDAIRVGLSEGAYAEAWAAGRAMEPEAALAEAETLFAAYAAPAERGPAHGPSERAIAEARLTPREVQIVRLLATGRTDREIAEALSVSRRTVGRHVGYLRGKLGAANRAEVAILAARCGLT